MVKAMNYRARSLTCLLLTIHFIALSLRARVAEQDERELVTKRTPELPLEGSLSDAGLRARARA